MRRIVLIAAGTAVGVGGSLLVALSRVLPLT